MKNLFTLLLISCAFHALSQTPLSKLTFMDLISGGGLGRSYQLGIDPENNLIIGGTYYNYGAQSLVYQGDTILSDLNTTGDILIMKLSPDGQLLWLKRFESDDDLYLQGLVVDKTGSIILRFTNYMPGTFQNVNFDPGNNLVKLSPDGNYTWHHTIRGLYSFQSNNMLTLDCADNIITGGNTDKHSTGIPIDTIIWAPDTIIQYQLAPDSIGLDGVLYPPLGYDNLSILKFQPDGALVWLKQYPAYAFMSDISAEYGSDIVFSGMMYDDTIAMDAVNLVKNDTAAGIEYFYAKLDGDGNALWAHTYFDDAYAWDVKTAPGGAVYVATEFYLTTTYQNTTVLSNGVQDMLLYRLDSLGEFEWARGVGDQYTNQIGKLCVDKKGEVVLSSFTINSGELAHKYDPQGNLIWILPDNGDSGNNGSGPAAFDTEGNMWLIGWFNGDFGMGPYAYSIWGGPSYTFLSKFIDQDIPGPLNSCSPVIATPTTQVNEEVPLGIFPNPACASVELSTPHPLASIRVFSVDGQLLESLTPSSDLVIPINLESYQAGLLFFECIDFAGKHSVQKCVKL